MEPAAARREQLLALETEASRCTRCTLAETRQTVVFGVGNPDADLLFVGEAPGANEDRGGEPFIGQAGRLLDQLLQGIGLGRRDVFIANVLKCRPPGNRDPRQVEIATCRPYLHRQVELIAPQVICTLGNFSTKLLRNDPTGISKIHGRAELREVGSRTVRLLPLYHPAAALYMPTMVETLRADFAQIPALLASGPPPQRHGVGGERGGADGRPVPPGGDGAAEEGEPRGAPPAPVAARRSGGDRAERGEGRSGGDRAERGTRSGRRPADAGQLGLF